MRIAVDLLGGDDAPAVVVDGALRALDVDPRLALLLIGPQEVADEVFDVLDPARRARVAVRAVRGRVDMADHPSRAARPGTTLRAAVAAVADGEADAVVSAGSTGAIVTAAALGLGRWPGVRRPALAVTMPASGGRLVLLDVGGSLESRPGTLVTHAALGATYAAATVVATRPRVGLLSVGTEVGKGDRYRREADAIFREQRLPGGGYYVGLVEGYDITRSERADVVVTDGFTGNVLLKAIEGAYALAGGPTNSGTPRAATLLGVSGTVVVCHGAADGDDLASGIALAARLSRRGVISAARLLFADVRQTTQGDTQPGVGTTKTLTTNSSPTAQAGGLFGGSNDEWQTASSRRGTS